jgi:hypothetical protein
MLRYFNEFWASSGKFLFCSGTLKCYFFHESNCTRVFSDQVLPAQDVKEATCKSRRPTEVAFALDQVALGAAKTKVLLNFIHAMLQDIDQK